MANPFLFVFNERLGTRQAVVDALDKIPEVPFWYSPFPFGVFLTSNVTASELARRIEQLIPGAEQAQWIILEIDQYRAQGRLSAKAWNLINKPDSPMLPGP